MRRLPGWQPRLRAYLANVQREPFQYGRLDCGLFAAGAVAAMTGMDPARKWRGRYSTFKGALRALRKDGFDDQVAVARALFQEIPVLTAREGDWAVVDGDGGPALGVVVGAQIAVMMPAGLGFQDLTTARTAFRV